MRAPPPVHVDVDGGPAWRAVRASLAGAAAGVPLAWAAPWVVAGAPDWLASFAPGPAAAVRTAPADGPVVALMAAATLAAAVVGAVHRCRLRRRERSTPPGRLRWDGSAWSLLAAPGAAAVPGAASLMLDFGGWMLVHFRPAGPAGAPCATWLPLRRSSDPARWCALRAALWTWRAEARPST
jgi:hypothetical protein